jgi:carbon storage regulator
MLCINRRRGEEIVIRTPEGRMIKLAILDSDTGKVRIGILADRDVSINRAEIDERVQAERAGKEDA